MKSVPAVFVILMIASILNAADPSFSLSDMSADNHLLFSCGVDQPGWGVYNSLLLADLTDGDSLTELTHFPEYVDFFRASGELQVHNRFGLYRMNLTVNDRFRRVSFHPSFVQGDEIPEGRILPVATSPDGRWVLVQEPKGPVRGDLVLYDIQRGGITTVSEDHVLDYRNPPVQWSPDSRYMLYARNGKLYYFSVGHVEDERIPNEGYREFGPGTLDSIRWTGSDALFYIRGSQINLVRPSEFFTRSFYLDPLPIGNVIGSLPVDFDPHFDSFWPSPDGKSLLVLKENRNLFLFPLSVGDVTGKQTAVSLPFLLLPHGTTVLQIWWRTNGEILLLAGGSRRDGSPTMVYHLNPEEGCNSSFTLMDIPQIRRFIPSPNRLSVAFLESDGVSIRDSDDFKEQRFITHPDPRNLFWLEDDLLLVAGGRRTEAVNLTEGSTYILALSQVDEAGFDAEGNITALGNGREYIYNPSLGAWKDAGEGRSGMLRRPRFESAVNRVYLENLQTASYANHIMVRTVDGFGNRALFNVPVPEREDLPGDEEVTENEEADEHLFNHGSRTRRREVALVFDAVDGDEGLEEVLTVLADYDINATFFICGDFIRRQPESAIMLAKSNHEIGSLFYTHMDMTDYRYRIDGDFVVRGLGRNEDEYFRATGSEVSTLWHAPWYIVGPSILDATRRMGYVYVGRDVDPLDWVTLDASYGTRDLYERSPVLVERTLEEKKPGSIISVRIGKPGTREDYFFRKLDLLINGLLKAGYDIVTIGELRDHAQ